MKKQRLVWAVLVAGQAALVHPAVISRLMDRPVRGVMWVLASGLSVGIFVLAAWIAWRAVFPTRRQRRE